MAELKEDEKAWVDVLHRFRALQASEKHVSDLRQNTMPSLEKQVFEESAMLDKAQEQVEEGSSHKTKLCLLWPGKAQRFWSRVISVRSKT